MKILILGAAGLVGQNLLKELDLQGFRDVIAVDRNSKKLNSLKASYPGLTTQTADLGSEFDNFDNIFQQVDLVIMLQARITGTDFSQFYNDNVLTTKNSIKAMKRHNVSNLILVSSSVVKSQANDFYSKTKRTQEALVLDSKLNFQILRPTLMFGKFDEKHLGWLTKFMSVFPIFPVPGDGKFKRQPLFVNDFCKIILSMIKKPQMGQTFNISGLEVVTFIDMIKTIKKVKKAKTVILKVPFPIFYLSLFIVEKIIPSPPFTTQQLSALIIDEQFEIIPWDTQFGVAFTNFADAIEVTFNDSV